MHVPKALKEKAEAEVRVNDILGLISVSRNAMTWTIPSPSGLHQEQAMLLYRITLISYGERMLQPTHRNDFISHADGNC